MNRRRGKRTKGEGRFFSILNFFKEYFAFVNCAQANSFEKSMGPIQLILPRRMGFSPDGDVLDYC